MKVLVTGGAGFIGSHVADTLLAAGHQVTVVDDLSTGHRANIPDAAEFIRLDIRSEQFSELIERRRPPVIFHLAAQMDVRRSVADPVFDADVNVLGTVRLLQAARRAGTGKVIFSSTGGAIYGEQQSFPADESHPCRPESPYGLAKLCAEHYLDYFSRSGGPAYVALRYGNVYGPRQDPHGEAGVVAIFTGAMLEGRTPVINGDGRQTRDFVYVGDVARANLLAMEKDCRGVFNIGTGTESNISELASLLQRATGYKGEIRNGTAQPGEQRRSCIDPSLARQVLAWQPEIPLDRGLAHTVEYFRNH